MRDNFQVAPMQGKVKSLKGTVRVRAAVLLRGHASLSPTQRVRDYSGRPTP